MRIRTAAALGGLVCLLAPALTACGEGDGPKAGVPTTTPPSLTASTTPTPEPEPEPTDTPTATSTPEPDPEPVPGIDVSHHKGAIDWAQVAAHGIEFAYLKASEGTGFVDPRFAANRTGAAQHGIAVNGYHYFQLCSDGTAQAEHFLAVLGGGPDDHPALPPAIDLELAGSCADPPAADVLLGEVNEFLDLVDERLETTTLVYLYPEFEERFGFADDLADHPQWVRRLGDRAPQREWSVWQHSDSGSVPGIAGGVDLNWMKPGRPGTNDTQER